MSNTDKQNIKVSIDGITLPMTVLATEEKIYRDAASLIQERIQRLRDMYPNVPNDKYYYIMAMLNTAVDAVRTSNRVDDNPYRECIADLTREIDKII